MEKKGKIELKEGNLYEVWVHRDGMHGFMVVCCCYQVYGTF